MNTPTGKRPRSTSITISKPTATTTAPLILCSRKPWTFALFPPPPKCYPKIQGSPVTPAVPVRAAQPRSKSIWPKPVRGTCNRPLPESEIFEAFHHLRGPETAGKGQPRQACRFTKKKGIHTQERQNSAINLEKTPENVSKINSRHFQLKRGKLPST